LEANSAHLVRGSLWLIGLRWSLRLMGLLSTVILARLLTPADYGIVAIATIIVGGIEVFSRAGQGTAIVRHLNPTREHYDSAWTIQLLIGIGIGVVIWLTIPLTTWYFAEPRAAPVIAVLALRTMMLGSINIGVNNFSRDLQFHKRYWFDVIPSAFSFFITLGAGITLRNYWALVLGIISQHGCSLVLSYTMSSYRPRICFAKVGDIWSFSTWALFTNIGQFLNNQIDKIAVGGFAGANSMGRYHVARDVATSPTQEIADPLMAVLLPVMATVQTDHQKRKDVYLNVLYWAAITCTSAAVGVALVAEDMVDVVLGPQWHSVAPLMPWFSLAWGVLGICSSVYAASDTVGKAYVSARLQWISLIALAAVIIPVAIYFQDLESIAITRFVIALGVAPLMFYTLSDKLEIPLSEIGFALWRPVLASLCMAVTVIAVNVSIAFTGWPRLLLDIAVGSGTYTICVMVLWVAYGRPSGPETVVAGALRNAYFWVRGGA
jgi:lipopolysaccharide exporter